MNCDPGGWPKNDPLGSWSLGRKNESEDERVEVVMRKENRGSPENPAEEETPRGLHSTGGPDKSGGAEGESFANQIQDEPSPHCPETFSGLVPEKMSVSEAGASLDEMG